ncbi:hypothetical protein AA106556_2096 [Neokomagataea tanensis NBRC 106556]|uniref:Uncharacterized protein n=1 Tax=Neokomagataea tanensis NBRC 106556 TaxID=1223519 RepID=A0ABQ0QLR2_9PROT|nr:hypothetical protein AA106556_2096 [Neokomagataea tanensis NBRC 106556]
MEDTNDHAPDTITETFSTVHMYHSPDEIPMAMTHGIMCGEIVPEMLKNTPFVAHEMGFGMNIIL